MTARNRHDDPEGFTPPLRERKPEGNEITATWGGKGVSVKGGVVILFLAVLALIASQLYAGFRVESAIKDGSAEHRNIKVGMDRTSCIVTMKPEEREKFRADFRPGAFRQWCPWVEEPEERR